MTDMPPPTATGPDQPDEFAESEALVSGFLASMRNHETRLAARSHRRAPLPDALRIIPEVGRYAFPSEHCYAAHLALIQDASFTLQFSPTLHPAFDALLATAPTAHHEALVVLRNAIMVQFFSEHAHASDVAHLKAIARFLQKPLRRLNPQGCPRRNAQQLYKALISRQETPLWRMPSAWFASSRPQQWRLLALTESSFSEEALYRELADSTDAPASHQSIPRFDEMVDRNSMDPRKQQEAQPQQSAAEQLNSIANDIAAAGALTMSVEELHEPTKRESIRLAKEILDKLRVKFGEAMIAQGLDITQFDPLVLLEDLKEAVQAFEFHLHKLAGMDTTIYENPAVMRANEAIGKFSHIAKKISFESALAQGDPQMAALLQADIAQLPASWTPAADDTFGLLIDDLSNGLDAVLERINQIGEHDAGAEFWLGLQTDRSLGGTGEPAQTGGMKKQEKTMEDDQYYRQLMAQRALRARQAAMRYMQAMQRQQKQQNQQDGPPQPQAKAHNSGLGNLLSSDMVQSMRSAMKTTAGAGEVETGNKGNIQQVIRQKEQAVRAQRTRVTIEQINRANRRAREQREHSHDDHAPQDLPPPPGKKKDRGHTV